MERSSARQPRKWDSSLAQFLRWVTLAGFDPKNRRGLGEDIDRSRVLATREEVYSLFRAIVAEGIVPPARLRELSRHLAEVSTRRELSVAKTSVEWVWRFRAGDLEQILAPILWDAGEILSSGAFVNLRQCQDQACGWLFLDRSQARKRRWCSMADCGNRHKARRFYQKRSTDREV